MMFKRIIQTIRMHFTRRKVEALEAEIERSATRDDWAEDKVEAWAFAVQEAYWPSPVPRGKADFIVRCWSRRYIRTLGHDYCRERDRRRAIRKVNRELADLFYSLLDSIGC